MPKSAINRWAAGGAARRAITEKRNSGARIVRSDARDAPITDGVGGRQAGPLPWPRGGGYLDTRTPTKSRPDPRLDELREIGLSGLWIRVAECIGVDAFLAMWRCVDGDHRALHDSGQLKLWLRRYHSYLRYQRNRYVRTLARQGVPIAQIKLRLETQLDESLTPRQIRWLINHP